MAYVKSLRNLQSFCWYLMHTLICLFIVKGAFHSVRKSLSIPTPFYFQVDRECTKGVALFDTSVSMSGKSVATSGRPGLSTKLYQKFTKSQAGHAQLYCNVMAIKYRGQTSFPFSISQVLRLQLKPHET